MNEMTGAKPLDPNLPITQQETVTITRDIFAQMRAYRADHDGRVEALTPVLSTVDTAASFKTSTTMENCKNAAQQVLKLDQEDSAELENLPSKVRARLDQSDLSTSQKEDYLKGFSESFSASAFIAARQTLLETEKKWVEATNDLYGYAEKHASDIQVIGDQLLIKSDAVREQFNSKLGIAEELRKEVVKESDAADQIRATKMKSAGITEGDLK